MYLQNAPTLIDQLQNSEIDDPFVGGGIGHAQLPRVLKTGIQCVIRGAWARLTLPRIAAHFCG